MAIRRWLFISNRRKLEMHSKIFIWDEIKSFATISTSISPLIIKNRIFAINFENLKTIRKSNRISQKTNIKTKKWIIKKWIDLKENGQSLIIRLGGIIREQK